MESQEAFFEAIIDGDVLAVEEMLAREPELVNAHNKAGQSAVLTAAYSQRPLIAALLVDRGAQLNYFEAAAVGEFEKVVEHLDRDPGLLDEFSPDGYQALGLAAFFGHKAVVELLLDRGAQAHHRSRNPQRVTPLHSAAASNQLEIARLLLEHGAGPNSLMAGSFTPLHTAAANGNIDMVRLMLDHQGEPGMETEAGQTALDLAEERGHAEVAKVLRKNLDK
jgi:uncharacterized protein